MTPLGIEPANSRLVAQCLNKLRHCVPSLLLHQTRQKSRDSVGYGLAGRRMSAWTRDRSYSEASVVATGPTQSLVEQTTGALSQGGKVAGAEDKNKLSSFT